MAVRKLNFLPKNLAEWSQYFGTLFREGSFTATLTGVSDSPAPTGTVYYTISGNMAILNLGEVTIQGTSDSAEMSLTGIPDEMVPFRDIRTLCRVIDNGGASEVATALIDANTNVIAFFRLSGSFTSSGTKGVPHNTLIYPIRG